MDNFTIFSVKVGLFFCGFNTYLSYLKNMCCFEMNFDFNNMVFCGTRVIFLCSFICLFFGGDMCVISCEE